MEAELLICVCVCVCVCVCYSAVGNHGNAPDAPPLGDQLTLHSAVW